MIWIARLLWFLFRKRAQVRFVAEAKRRGLRFYLRAVQGTRLFLVMSLLAFFLLLTVVLAGFGAVITGVWLLDIETQTKLWILFALFATLFFVPVIALFYVFSEALWYRLSGAEKMVDDLMREKA